MTITVNGQSFPDVTWYKDSAIRRLYFHCGILTLGSATIGFDGSMMNGLQSLPYWQSYFQNPSASTLGILNAILPIGHLISYPMVPWLADHVGRKKTIICGILGLSLAVALQTCATSMSALILARFFIGFCGSFVQVASPILITEIAHPQHRAIIATIYNTSWYIGAIFAAWATFGSLALKNNWSWRLPSLLQASTSVIQLMFIWFVPESPRFLIAAGDSSKAFDVLQQYHGPISGVELVRAEFEEIRDTIDLEKHIRGHGWSVLWSTRGNRHRLGICIAAGVFSQWSGNGLVSYYMAEVLDAVGITNPSQQLRLNGILMVYNWLISFSICLLVDHFGRRPLFLSSAIGMLTSFTTWTASSALYAFSSSGGTAATTVASIFAYYLAYDLAWCGLLISYTVEILPYQIRARGLAVMQISIQFANTCGNYVNPIGMAHFGWMYNLIFVVVLILEFVVVYMFFLETKQASLEEISIIFDGKASQAVPEIEPEIGMVLQSALLCKDSHVLLTKELT